MFQCTFTGNLGKAPKYIRDDDGTPIALFNVAISRGKDQPAFWVSVTLKGKPAETFAALDPGVGARVVVACNYAPKVEIFTNSAGKPEACVKMRAEYCEVANLGRSE